MSRDDELRSGQRYRTREELEVSFVTHWGAAFSGGGEGRLPAGTVFTIGLDPPAIATAAYCDPEDYAAVEQTLVSAEDRAAPSYAGFSLLIALETIRTRCERL